MDLLTVFFIAWGLVLIAIGFRILLSHLRGG